MRTMTTNGFEIADLDQRAARYRSVLSGMRLCQLYAFWILLDVILRPLAALTQLIGFGAVSVWAALSGFDPGPAPDLSPLLTYTRGPVDILLLALVWVIFAFHSRFRAHIAVSVAGAALVLFNLARFRAQIYAPETGFLAGMEIIAQGGRLLYLEPEVRSARAAYLGLIVLLHLQFLYIAFRGQRVAAAMSNADRAAFSEYARGERVFIATSMRLLQLPDAIRYARRKLATGALLLIAGLANLINYWLVLSFAILACAAWPVYRVLETFLRWEGLGAGRQPVAILVTLLVFALALSVGLWLRFIVNRATRIARRFMRRSLEDVQHLDARPPILFLRSFLNDQVALNARRFDPEQWLFDGTQRNANLDQILLAEGTVFGPSVALGDPGDPAPPYGAARGYFDHADWQAAVAGLCRDASAIIMALDSTEGVEWEVAHLATGRYAPKTLLLLAPEDAVTENGRAMLRRAATRIFGEAAGAVLAARDDAVAIGFDATGRPRVHVSTDLSADGYTILIREYLRGLSARTG